MQGALQTTASKSKQTNKTKQQQFTYHLLALAGRQVGVDACVDALVAERCRDNVPSVLPDVHLAALFLPSIVVIFFVIYSILQRRNNGKA